MKYTIVVARYNEDVNWTNKFSNVIIYNKGAPISGEFNQVLMKNVGREAHTYYRYIVDNYNNLEEYTIFLQGYPFIHSENLFYNLFINYINKEDLDIDFAFLSEHIAFCNLTGCEYHPGLPLIELYEKIFGEKKTDLNFLFGAGAQFIVSRKRILKRPIEFYLNIVEILESNMYEWTAPWVIERFHRLIFS
jgi:hypothetical protein